MSSLYIIYDYSQITTVPLETIYQNILCSQCSQPDSSTMEAPPVNQSDLQFVQAALLACLAVQAALLACLAVAVAHVWRYREGGRGEARTRPRLQRRV